VVDQNVHYGDDADQDPIPEEVEVKYREVHSPETRRQALLVGPPTERP
jgi:hypothetical protein